MGKSHKKRAQAPAYVSPKQMTIGGFESPFERELNPNNRWVVLAHLLPWDDIVSQYIKVVGIKSTGRPGLSPRVIIGALIIKHLGNLDDRETVAQISENIYMQYFLGYPGFSTEEPFDASLFVEIRKRLGADSINAINDRIVQLRAGSDSYRHAKDNSEDEVDGNDNQDGSDSTNQPKNDGRVLYDATACPQDIAFPTDLNLLNDAREKLEEIIDVLYDPELLEKKPRTYREVARTDYLHTAQKRKKTAKDIRKAVRKQLAYVSRDLRTINALLDKYDRIPLQWREHRYLLVINTLYEQQKQMFDTRTHSIEDRIVSIHQPHVRPIVRGKAQAKVEFGAKIHVSLIDGLAYLDELSWDAFNEGSHMESYIEQFRKRHGHYPAEVLADKIYCTRANRAMLKERNIKLVAKPLGRPSAVSNHVSPGERNPIEGKFGQGKTAYGLNRIRARLKGTSESWIASIILVLNLVKLAGEAPLCLIILVLNSFSALKIKVLREINLVIQKMFFRPQIIQI